MAVWIMLAAIPVLALAVHLFGVANAIARCRRDDTHIPVPAGAPSVSLVIPVCGLDNFVTETLRSAFTLDYPRAEILFCVARADDPVVPVVRALIAQYPAADARILVGDARISGNPKLNNVAKGWQAAAGEFVVMPDSNVLMPRDYIQRLFAQYRDDTGIVSSPPVGCAPDGFFAEVECAFLNGYQIRWQYLADTIGLGFAQGKTMLWRKADLEKAGGIRELGLTAAEDAASTKIVRAMGLRVRLVEPPVCQPLGKREALAVWHRQRRWARLRRASFPLCFAPEILTTSLVPLAAAMGAAFLAGVSPFAAAIAVAILWYGSEAVLAAACGWPLSRRTIPAAIVRDLMLPVLWLDALLGNGFEWRGTQMHAVESGAGAS